MTENHPGPGEPGPPQPGIVPLRPLDAGEILGGAWRYVRRRPVLTLVPALVLMVVVLGVQGLLMLVEPAPPPTLDLVEAFAGSMGSALLVALLGALVTPPFAVLLLAGLHLSVIGQRPTLRSAWAAGRDRLGAAYGAQLILTAIGLVPTALVWAVSLPLWRAGGVAAAVGALIAIAAYLAVLWVTVLLALTLPAVVRERCAAVDALWRSVELVRGAWWRCFGVLLLLVLVMLLVGIVAGAVAGLGAVGLVVAGFETAAIAVFVGAILVVAVPGTALGQGVYGLLHQDRWLRRDGGDAVARVTGPLS
ncbi:hypothetical protein DMP17_43415 [Pseudonocardia sp. TMWB2A]|uniref:hypothetical protein n=1 Tax=Pseudonocardia sp. TMWB2A TaxID=687430 RepID=UPI00307E2960